MAWHQNSCPRTVVCFMAQRAIRQCDGSGTQICCSVHTYLTRSHAVEGLAAFRNFRVAFSPFASRRLIIVLKRYQLNRVTRLHISQRSAWTRELMTAWRGLCGRMRNAVWNTDCPTNSFRKHPQVWQLNQPSSRLNMSVGGPLVQSSEMRSLAQLKLVLNPYWIQLLRAFDSLQADGTGHSVARWCLGPNGT